MKRIEIVEAARVWKGVRWTHMGRTETGIDCAGLIVMLARQFDVPHEDMTGYGRLAQGEKFVDQFKRFLPIAAPPLRIGQVVILNDDALPCHAGIIGENYGKLTLIHATVRDRKVVEENWTPAWNARFRLALEFPGVEEA